MLPPVSHYYRDYAGFANSVCYEFHLRTSSLARQDPLSELENIVSSVKLFPRNATPVLAGELETPFPLPDEVREIFKLASWNLSYPRIGMSVFRRQLPLVETSGDNNPSPTPTRPAPLPSTVPFNAITLTSGSDLADDAAATAAITKLQQEVAQILQQHQWIPANGASASGPPTTYRRGDSVAELSVGTGRCTMNSPCSAFDSLTVTVYIAPESN